MDVAIRQEFQRHGIFQGLVGTWCERGHLQIRQPDAESRGGPKREQNK